MAKLVDDYGMVSFTPLDIRDEDRYGTAARSCGLPVLAHIVQCICCVRVCMFWQSCGHVCSIAATLLQVDTAIQYGEDTEVQTKDIGSEDFM